MGVKKYDVRFIIGSFGRSFSFALLLDVMVDVRALERVCYEESLKGRFTVVGVVGGFIIRGVLVIVFELGKSR